MRILYLAASAVPAAGRANSIQVMHMCAAFAQAGHAVRLVTPDRPERIRTIDPFGFYGVESRFPIEWLSWIPLQGRGYVYAWQAARRARRYRPDLVYTRSIAACYFSTRLGLSSILEVHGPIDRREVLLAFMFRKIIPHPKLKRLVVSSAALAGHLQERYAVPPARLLVAPNCADEQPASTETIRLDADRFHAGYVGGFRRGKGLDLLAQLPPLTPEVDYHVVGGSPAEVDRWRSAMGHVPNIIFYGQVAPSQTYRYMHAFDVLLAPYQRMQGDVSETGLQTEWLSPLKIVEYMAAGKPILCSDLPVYREVLTHGRTAMLCPADDPRSWAAALDTLRADPDLRAALGRAALAEFRERYTWSARQARVLAGL